MKQFTLLFTRQDTITIEQAVLVSFMANAESGELALTAAIGQWLAAEGRGLDVEGDFNIGDLWSHVGDGVTDCLNKYGINCLVIKEPDVMMNYDKNFVKEDLFDEEE
jgi:hypothetical protein